MHVDFYNARYMSCDFAITTARTAGPTFFKTLYIKSRREHFAVMLRLSTSFLTFRNVGTRYNERRINLDVRLLSLGR
jgi:hypothetical protein